MANASRIEGREAVSKTALDKDPVKGASAKPYVTYAPCPDATPEGELAALTATYAFVIQAHEQKKAAAPAKERRKEVDSEERRQGQDR
jgi:hypothetical protein